MEDKIKFKGELTLHEVTFKVDKWNNRKMEIEIRMKSCEPVLTHTFSFVGCGQGETRVVEETWSFEAVTDRNGLDHSSIVRAIDPREGISNDYSEDGVFREFQKNKSSQSIISEKYDDDFECVSEVQGKALWSFNLKRVQNLTVKICNLK